MKKKLLICGVIVAIVVIVIITIITSNKGIELTMENYSKYLNITISCFNDGDRMQSKEWGQINSTLKKSKSISWSFYPQMSLNVHVNGVSSNFNYENIEIIVQFTGEYYIYRLNTENPQIEFVNQNVIVDNCNISGEGNNNFIYDIPNNGYSQDTIQGKVISVSGTVKPIK